ncbi:MAG TPA: Asp23/Gls24 family envelope stress response protein [Clostridia bacterium]|nr:Asp23/Gls24 family envelope stress response protein [Clostridia bacterium]
MKQKQITKYGSIKIDKKVIEDLARKAASECYGVLAIVDVGSMDSVIQKLKKETISGGVRASEGEEGLILDVYVSLQYGVRTAAVAENIMETVKYQIESTLELPVEEVNVFIQSINVGE